MVGSRQGRQDGKGKEVDPQLARANDKLSAALESERTQTFSLGHPSWKMDVSDTQGADPGVCVCAGRDRDRKWSF